MFLKRYKCIIKIISCWNGNKKKNSWITICNNITYLIQFYQPDIFSYTWSTIDRFYNRWYFNVSKIGYLINDVVIHINRNVFITIMNTTPLRFITLFLLFYYLNYPISQIKIIVRVLCISKLFTYVLYWWHTYNKTKNNFLTFLEVGQSTWHEELPTILLCNSK